jgi:dUTP pyrophosphatase
MTPPPPPHHTPAQGGHHPARPIVRFLKLDPRAAVPAYQTLGAAGLDLSACLPESPNGVTIDPGSIVLVSTGLAVAIPTGFEGQVRARSGLSTKHGIGLPNAPGTIDSDYRGELRVALINLGKQAFTVTHGMRIAQLVIAPIAHAVIEEVDALDDTARGSGGFGSTGTAARHA